MPLSSSSLLLEVTEAAVGPGAAGWQLGPGRDPFSDVTPAHPGDPGAANGSLELAL